MKFALAGSRDVGAGHAAAEGVGDRRLTWGKLDWFLVDLAERIGSTAHHLSDAGKYQLSPCFRYERAQVARLEAAYQLLCRDFGDDFLHKGKGERTVREGASWSFVAEVLLSSYLLVFLFDGDLNPFVVRRELDKAKPQIEAMIERLPPVDGGGRTTAKGMPIPS